jgi:putative PIG3 family NAD(P)H quinone oxidoreductase
MSETMRAVTVEEGAALRIAEAARPKLRPGEVLLRVHAAGLNRADLSQRFGRYAPVPGESEILGLEAAGEVVAVAPELEGSVAAAWMGRRAMALLPGGGYAEYVAVPVDMLMRVPSGWSMVQAAAFPETAFTAYLNLFEEASLAPGERVLIHAGASGVGTVAIRMAKAVGCEVFATAGGAAKVAACSALGADVVIDRHRQDFADVIADRTGGEGVDVVLDVVGGASFGRNVTSLRTGGRVVCIAALAGAVVEIDLFALMDRLARVVGSKLRSRPKAEKVRLKRNLLERFEARIEDGSLTPVIDSVFPWDEVEAAQARMRANRNVGKIVLRMLPDADRPS